VRVAGNGGIVGRGRLRSLRNPTKIVEFQEHEGTRKGDKGRRLETAKQNPLSQIITKI
jgi:hypothetical protein